MRVFAHIRYIRSSFGQVEVAELSADDQALVTKVHAGGIAALRGSERPVYNAHWKTTSGRSAAADKGVLLQPPAALLAEPADAGVWRVVLFSDGEVECIPTAWATAETQEEAEDEDVIAEIKVKETLLLDGVQDGGLRAMRQSGRVIHEAKCRDDDGKQGATTEKCLVLRELPDRQRVVVLFSFGTMQSDSQAKSSGSL